MNASPNSPSKRVALLCTHLESLCQQAVSLIQCGETTILAHVESRKTVVLQELTRLLADPATAMSRAARDEMVQRIRTAITAQLQAAIEEAKEISVRLNECRLAARRAGSVRHSYGSSPYYNPLANARRILACG